MGRLSFTTDSSSDKPPPRRECEPINQGTIFLPFRWPVLTYTRPRLDLRAIKFQMSCNRFDAASRCSVDKSELGISCRLVSIHVQ